MLETSSGEIQIKAEQNLQDIFLNRVPKTFSEALRLAADYSEQIELMKPKAEAYDQFLDSNGELSCTEASEIVRLYYINPKGKKERMGNKYFLQILVYDHIIHKEYNGYRIYATHKEYGRTKQTVHRERLNSCVLFNTRGVDYLIKKYKNDNRIWRAVGGKLCCQDAA